MTAVQTTEQYKAVAAGCREVFLAKLADYGPSWHVFRLLSIVDQIFIKAKRIRRLEELEGQGQVPEGPEDEYVGIVNYCVIAIDKLLHSEIRSSGDVPEGTPDRWRDSSAARATYDQIIAQALALLDRKNHDYDEAWRDMALSSLTDEILGRTARIKHMLASEAGPTASEGLDAQLWDALNYSVLALVKMRNRKAVDS